MNASPQPTVVPADGDGLDGRSDARTAGPAVDQEHALRPEGHDQALCRGRSTIRDRRCDIVVIR